MNSRILAYAPLLFGLMAAPVFAQTNDVTSTPAPVVPPVGSAPANDPNAVQRDINQQDRVDNGLKSGNLSTKEAGQIERGENRIDRTEARDEKNGVTPQETQQIQHEQNQESRTIQRDDTNAVKGNPNSASSQRMQTDAQRNANQQQRIENGVNNGSLSTKETGRLERGQANDDRAQANAARNGNVSAAEQSKLQRQQNRNSGRIYRKKHNNQTTANPTGTAPAAQ